MYRVKKNNYEFMTLSFLTLCSEQQQYSLGTFNESLLSFFSKVDDESLLLKIWKWCVCTAAPCGSEN